MSTITGVVEAKTKGKTKFGTYGIKVGDYWYNSKFEIPANRGDKVQFETDSKHNINGLKVIEESSQGSGAPVSNSNADSGQYKERQRMIVRQSSLGHAVTFMQGQDDVNVSDVLEVAEQFEQWVYRGLEDGEESEKNDPPFEV